MDDFVVNRGTQSVLVAVVPEEARFGVVRADVVGRGPVQVGGGNARFEHVFEQIHRAPQDLGGVAKGV